MCTNFTQMRNQFNIKNNWKWHGSKKLKDIKDYEKSKNEIQLFGNKTKLEVKTTRGFSVKFS